MALLLRGRTVCKLCGRVIAVADPVVLFPSGLFAVNEPAFEVNDAAVHSACLDGKPYAADAIARCAAYVEAVGGTER